MRPQGKARRRRNSSAISRRRQPRPFLAWPRLTRAEDSNDEEAACAAECAAEQDAFWEMHDHLFAEQASWTNEGAADELFAAYAAELELDGPAFQRCYQENRVAQRIERANEVAGQLGVRATPTFVINGERIEGALPPAKFREILEKAASERDGT